MKLAREHIANLKARTKLDIAIVCDRQNNSRVQRLNNKRMHEVHVLAFVDPLQQCVGPLAAGRTSDWSGMANAVPADLRHLERPLAVFWMVKTNDLPFDNT